MTSIYQVSVQCPDCAEELRVILGEEAGTYCCEKCSRQVIKATRLAGAVYVLSHPHVAGVKIGMTEGDVYRRAKAVSGTGVPGEFRVIAYFHSHRPKQDEKKVHAKLSRFSLGKEHFDLGEALAIAKVRSILAGRDPMFVHGEVREEYEKIVEERREKALRRLGKIDG